MITKRFISSGLIAMVLLSGVNLASPRFDVRRKIRPVPGLALVGAKIYPSPTEAAITDGVVLIKGSKIVEAGKRGQIRIPADFETVNCAGLTLTAGFWNSHVHLIGTEWTDAATQSSEKLSSAVQGMLTKFGFTSVFDTGSLIENTSAIRRRIDSGEISGPRIFTTGMLIFPKGASPHAIGLYPELKFPEVETPDEARQVVQETLKGGADAIKIHIIGPIGKGQFKHMPLAAVKALTDEAHRQGRLALAHPGTPQGWQEAIDAGVDLILHSNPNPGAYTEAQINALVKNNKAVTPTLTLFRIDTVREGTPEIALKVQTQAVDWLTRYLKAGGKVLFGTDVGYIQEYDPTEEFQQMERAGMDFPQLLASLTTIPASVFGASESNGRIAAGLDADLVLLDGDPARDVKAFAKVRYTFRQGRIIYRKNDVE